MNKLLLLIKVSRPLGWGVAPAVFLFGLIASGSISGTTTLTPLAISQILLLSFPICIFAYGINDVYDYEADQINPKKGDLMGGFIEGSALEPAYHSYIKRVSFLVISLLLLTSFLTLSVTNVLGMLLLVFFSYFYSAPPLRFKERPPLDSFTNGMGYFFAPFLLGFSFSGSITNNVDVLIDVILITICVMGIHAYSAIGDYTADKKAGLKTFATVFGKRGAALFALLAFIITFFVAKVSPLIRPVTYYHVGICIVLFFITLVVPSEKPIKWICGYVFIGFVLQVIVFSIT
jgi:4-hydroxybenzoate polyprenyltransferase